MAEKQKKDHRALYVVIGAVLVIGILVTPVDAFSVSGVSFVDTELRGSDSAARQFVQTKYPIGDADALARFPKSMDEWNMTHQYEWDFIAELLDTDLLLARDYRAPGLYLPVSLLIVQSTNMSSFHPAPLCYAAQGYRILDGHTAVVDVTVENATWAREGLFGEDGRSFDGTVKVKRLVVEREINGATQRELNLYFYAREEQGGITEKVSWVRVSMYVPAKGDYSHHQAVLERFTATIVPELFTPVESTGGGSLASFLVGKIAGDPLASADQ